MSNYDSEGSILYCVCARGTKVLAEFTNPEVDSGNFPRIALQLLGNISLQDQRMTIQYDRYKFLLRCSFFDRILLFFFQKATISISSFPKK